MTGLKESIGVRIRIVYATLPGFWSPTLSPMAAYGSPTRKPSLVWGTAWAPQNCRSGRRWSKVLFLFFDLVTLSWVEILWVLFSHRVQNQELI